MAVKAKSKPSSYLPHLCQQWAAIAPPMTSFHTLRPGGTFGFGFIAGHILRGRRLCVDEAESMAVPMLRGVVVRQMLAITSRRIWPGATSPRLPRTSLPTSSRNGHRSRSESEAPWVASSRAALSQHACRGERGYVEALRANEFHRSHHSTFACIR